MNEARVRELLGDAIEAKDNGLHSMGWFLAWTPNETYACLDGKFTADELEAVAWWMRNDKLIRDAQSGVGSSDLLDAYGKDK